MKTSSLFYSLVGLSYFFAIISLYYQFPGLAGSDGLLPVDSFVNSFRKRHPMTVVDSLWNFHSLLFVAPDLYVTTDALVEFVFCVGLSVSVAISIGCHNSILFAIVWICFRTIRDACQTFTSFQWDILLLESGFLCILSTPLLSFRTGNYTSRIFNWCFRFLAFKLMLQAGVVKLQSQCPTWEGLSALEYHFATQCLPTYIGWYAHQLPPFLLRLSVAVTLIIEVPATVLLIFPLVRVRRIGCILQWLLQFVIFITGNYNYFNILTAVLMIKVWESDDVTIAPAGNTLINSNISTSITKTSENNLNGFFALFLDSLFSRLTIFFRVVDSRGPFSAIKFFCQNCEISSTFRLLEIMATVLFLAASSVYFISFVDDSRFEWWRGDWFRWKLPWKELQGHLSCWVIVCVSAVILFILSEWSHAFRVIQYQHSYQHQRATYGWYRCLITSLRAVRLFAVGIVAMSWIWLASLTFSTVCDVSPLYVVQLPQHWVDQASQVAAVSSYGLFRRMTGVGNLNAKQQQKQNLEIKRRWNSTYEPSLVARPEIVIEGLDAKTKKWVEIEFR